MVFNDKKSARAYFSSLRSAIPLSQRQAKSETICDAISKTEEFLSCDTLLLYYPIKSEPSTLFLFDRAMEKGIQIAFPISITETFTLDFHTVQTLDSLRTGAYGICEPPLDAPRPKITDKTICIVPALSFDGNKNRLGYGKGFYDRFLSNFDGISIGITFSKLICKRLPTDIYDIKVDKIITD